MNQAYRKWRYILGRARGLWFGLVIRACGGSVGQRLVVERGLALRRLPSRRWRLGDDVYIGYGVVLDVFQDAEFVLGSRVKIMHYTVVGVACSLRMDDDSGVAEHASIRDAHHRLQPGEATNTSPLTAQPIHIGARSGVGRGSAVLAGTTIGTGVAIGANSVVIGDIPSDSVAVGAPAKVIRNRAAG